ncbi:MAG TPA: 30S ribosomal protein S4 [Gemmatimonadaceae bacterium]|nr:30S ribosomal protein S4 [Gemmatimonadaceae bacterium]
MPVRSPRLKIVRRLGAQLPGLTRKDAGRAAPPRTRRKPSAYRLALEEKQKVRFNYGVTERQMRRYLEAAKRVPGRTGENLLLLLEQRLDNVVFRLGLAPTIPAARQLVAHGHVQVNGRRLDRAAYLVGTGDTVSLASSARASDTLRAVADQEPRLRVPSHLQRDPMDPCAGRVISAPARGEVPFAVKEALVVEFYAR